MKRCPTCQRVYQDEMSYCLEDGATLLREAETSSGASETIRIPAPRLTNQSPTEVLPASETQPPAQPPPQFAHQRHAAERMAAPQRKSKALPWILGAVILGLVGVVVGLMMMRGRDDTQTAQNTVQSENTSENTTASPESSPAASPIETPVGAPTPASETRSTPTERITEQASPTPKPTQSPKSSPPTVVAEEPPPPPPRPTPPRSGAPISGGILNGKAISMPKPAYPAIARAARASGTVTVQVTIDESGKVASARAITGHPLLQQAAVQAAYGARFSPTLLSGQPVKVTGVITYNFVAQ